MQKLLDSCVEPSPVKSFIDFGDYFGRFSILFTGVVYDVDTTPAKRIENRLKRTPKAMKLFTGLGSSVDSIFEVAVAGN